MPDSPSPSHPDYSKVGYGALGNVDVRHDASQHTTHNTTNNTTNHSTNTNTSHTHQEDNSQHHHVDQRVTKNTTVHQSGIPPVVFFGIICVIVAGLVLTILALKQGTPQQAVITIPTAPLDPVPTPPVMAAQDSNTPPSPATALPAPPNARPLELTLNRSSYAEGQLMEITVASQQAGYLYVLAVWGDGRVDTLFPNSLMPNAKITAGTRLRLPNDFPPTAGGEVLRYPMGMPALPGNPATATESILAVLSPAPLNLPKSTELASMPGFAAVGMMSDPEFRSRGPQPKYMKMQKAPTLDFGALPQAAVHYEVHR